MKIKLTILIATLLSLSVYARATELAKLPTDVKWETNNNDPIFSSPKAKKGGTFVIDLRSFPLTLRTVGPDSNGSFRSALLDNQTELTYEHPNTRNIIPGLATHWAYGKDNKTIYFKLNKNAKWSDGKKITTEDFVFALKFMRSKHIVAPWYNEHYTKEIDKIIVFDKHTFAIVGKTKKAPKVLHPPAHVSNFMLFLKHVFK